MMPKLATRFLIFTTTFFMFNFAFSQKDVADTTDLLNTTTFAEMKLRGIGPALMSGRIADIAIHPDDENLWYIAVGSGGVWKTVNAGVTWTPIFDSQPSYSIGCVAIDPNNPHVVWVGTGENVGGRHVGYGDGLYRSKDGGTSWENMGLRESEHISKIIVHPGNSDIIWVAAQGPLWSKGGERGLYKSIDGGKTWNKTLGDDAWIGVTDIVIDPRNPNWMYAATWQRQRNIASYMGGGPGSGVHRSSDGGETWEKLTSGLPAGDMAKIGLAISPQNPDVVYAAIELFRRDGGVFRSSDRGSSWVNMSEAVARGTGPHYYQELYACPHNFDKIYLMDVRIQVSENGGKTFKRLSEEHKHSDNHAIAFREDDPDYLLVGTDGGLYESFDNAVNWRFMPNLPLTQFYKLALDDAKPFYNIYGGTQDNSTQGGPSRTDNRHGIRTEDWFLVLGADGHQPATEPGNPDIMYAQWQQGNLNRIDRTTGEVIFIKPQPEAGEEPERYNWDAPILVSPHSPTRIYHASQRMWRSDDRGDSWTAISGDLTNKNQERIELPLMDKTWSWDAAWDFVAMSKYNTITSIAESPIKEGLIYIGTDDGIIQVTEDGGENWKKIEVGSLPDIPGTAYVNDIKADLFDESTVYIALDNHKFGDFNPYILKSTDKGKSWKSIKNNLPERTLVWRIVQDHVNKSLLFVGTEFGIYFTVDGGEKWVKVSGAPTIAFRDLAIQRRENDLVGASFGRGFYILDDYSPLRLVSEAQLKDEATVFPVRDAWWYIPRPVVSFGEKGPQGAFNFAAPNPPFGAEFTYYLGDGLSTKAAERKKEEAELNKENKSIPFPGWDELETERRQEEPKVILIIKDADGNIIRRIDGPTSKGIHRVAWDLKYSSTRAINIDRAERSLDATGFMAAPGIYSMTLTKLEDGATTILAGPVEFLVGQLYEGALEGSTPDEVAVFWRELEDIIASTSAASIALRNADKRVDAMRVALTKVKVPNDAFENELWNVKQELHKLDEELNGNRSKQDIGELENPTVSDRLGYAISGTSGSTYGPTPAHLRSFEIAEEEFLVIKANLEDIRFNQIPALELQLMEAGAPWIEGQPIPE